MEKNVVIFFLAFIGVGAFGQDKDNPKKQRLSDAAVYLKSDIDFLVKIKNLDGDSITFYEAYRQDVDLFASLVEEEKLLSAAFEASSVKLRYQSPPRKFLFFFKNKKKTNKIEVEKRIQAYSDLIKLNAIYSKIVPLRKQIDENIHMYGSSSHKRWNRLRTEHEEESRKNQPSN